MGTRCPAATSFGADSPLLGTGSGGTGEGRGAPCSMGARTPAPLSDNPPSPCETGWTPAFITQTFPLDLLTCHAVASMFAVWAAAPAHKAARVGRQNRIVSRWNRNNMARFPCVRVG